MLFNLGQMTRSPVQILDLCSKFESSSNILPSQDRNALRKYFKVTSLARSRFFQEQMILQNYLLFKSNNFDLYLLTTSGLCTMTTATSGIGAETGAATVAKDSLISLNSHEKTIILRECLGRLNIPLIQKGWRWHEFSIISVVQLCQKI
ncbi:Hypothetical_protein [Hexamita inflata]|uniref:Hypothetical_protein n=1 Tax=Hexamita inflata TaxID=28002 RepID=A0ABP1GDF6_9EUKA